MIFESLKLLLLIILGKILADEIRVISRRYQRVGKRTKGRRRIVRDGRSPVIRRLAK